MNFLNPAALFALIAASIPIVLHLLNLRKLRIVPFSSTTLLQQLQKSQIRRLQLRQLILLILRTLLIIFLVLAAARPVMEIPLPGFSSQAASSTIILLDNSFSMEIADSRGERFQQAKDAITRLLQASQTGDEFSLLLMADLTNHRWEEFSRDPSFILQSLPHISTAYTIADLSAALQKAATLMTNSRNINRVVIVVSDFQKANFYGLSDSLQWLDNDTHLFLLPIGSQQTELEQNISLDTVIVLTKIFEINKPVEVEVRLRNWSDKPAENVVVSMRFNGRRVVQRAINIAPHSTTTLNLIARPNARGAIHAVVELEGDILDADNRFFFGFVVPERPNVALIGPSSSLHFLRLAFVPDTGTQLVNLKTFSPQELPQINLNLFDIVYLVNLPAITPSMATQLRQYVLDGGGLVLMPGPATNTENYNTILLPTLGLSNVQRWYYPKDQPAEFIRLDIHHPIFEGVFKGPTSTRPPETPRIWTAMPLRDNHPIIEIADGGFLIERRLGNGHILWYAVPPTTEWSTFPLTGLFVTLQHRIVQYLSAAARMEHQFTVGEAIHLILPRRAAASGRVILYGPDSVQFHAPVIQLPEGATLSLPPFVKPGTWIVRSSDGILLAIFSVNAPALESELQFLEPNQILTKLSPLVADGHLHVLEAPQQLRTTLQLGAVATELWKLFLILALLCAIAEMLIAKAWRDELPSSPPVHSKV